MKAITAQLAASCLAFFILDGAVAPTRADEVRAPSGEPAGTAPPGAVQQYCTNIRDAAADARIARQTEALRELENEIERRIAELNEQQAEFEEWLRRREEFLAKAQEHVVAVYAGMRPDAAASQLSILDSEAAASVLANLQPRIASAILNEMEPQRAAELVLAIAGPVESPEVTASR